MKVILQVITFFHFLALHSKAGLPSNCILRSENTVGSASGEVVTNEPDLIFEATAPDMRLAKFTVCTDRVGDLVGL